MTSEWHPAPDFAEVAEALAVRTVQILSAMYMPDDTVLVMYGPDESTDIYAVLLRRDEDGVLQLAGVPELVPGFMEDLKKNIEKAVRDQLGEPGEE